MPRDTLPRKAKTAANEEIQSVKKDIITKPKVKKDEKKKIEKGVKKQSPVKKTKAPSKGKTEKNKKKTEDEEEDEEDVVEKEDKKEEEVETEESKDNGDEEDKKEENGDVKEPPAKKGKKGKAAVASSKKEKVENGTSKKNGEVASGKEDKASEEGDTEESTEMGDETWKKATSVYDFTVKNIKGEDVPLSKYRGNVLIIVNVASKCGYTSKHYKELVELDEQFKDKGLKILAFPCNQFGSQEPGDADQICEFTKKKNVQFDLFEKVNVNGDKADPLFKYLKLKQGGTLVDAIKWNFTKFIVDKNGIPVERHAATASPSSLIPNIEKYL